ncbi:MAG: hypothetical protein NTW03_13875, partial [Verrucomicrobia bacterium]|nr:hypothetical protein [Verrucomicrobiota bacterium]
VEADESLAALLARRDSVRSRQAGPVVAARPDLFQPQQSVETAPLAVPATPRGPAEMEAKPPEAEEGGAAQPEEPAGTTSRLLAAKRRAQRKMK